MDKIINFIISPLLPLAIIGAVFFLLEHFFASQKNQKLVNTDSATDISYLLFNTYLLGIPARYIVSFVLLCLVLGDDSTFTENSFYSNVPSFVKTILILIVVDFVGYVMHRIYHSGSFWMFHSIHHSTKEISWISSIRFHPIEPITVLLAQYIISVILLGFGIQHVTYAILLRSYYGYMVHANLSWSFGKLGYIFASPYFHRWHHTMEKEGIDKNFGGVFSAWDFIFGTAYFPKNKQPHNFGVPDEVGKNIWQQFVYPFEKIWGKKSKML